MHAIRTFIRAHLYGAGAPPSAAHAARASRAGGVAPTADRIARLHRARTITRALVRLLRSFDPRHHDARREWRAPA